MLASIDRWKIGLFGATQRSVLRMARRALAVKFAACNLEGVWRRDIRSTYYTSGHNWTPASCSLRRWRKTLPAAWKNSQMPWSRRTLSLVIRGHFMVRNTWLGPTDACREEWFHLLPSLPV